MRGGDNGILGLLEKAQIPYHKIHSAFVTHRHTEDKNITHRKELYTAEGKEYYNGNLYVPNDLEVIKL